MGAAAGGVESEVRSDVVEGVALLADAAEDGYALAAGDGAAFFLVDEQQVSWDLESDRFGFTAVSRGPSALGTSHFHETATFHPSGLLPNRRLFAPNWRGGTSADRALYGQVDCSRIARSGTNPIIAALQSFVD